MQNSYYTYVIFILIILTPSFVAQNNLYTIEHISKNDGLSQDSGIEIIQDSDGFIWIGTGNGLNKYDGINFTVYKNDKSNTNSLSHNYINSLFEDSNGMLWVGTNQGGINKFNKYSEEFTAFIHNPSDSNSIGQGSIYSIKQDRFGNIWIGVNPSGLYFFNSSDNSFHKFWLPDENKSKNKTHRALSIVIDDKDNIWVGTSNGVYKIQYDFDIDSIKNKTLLNDFNFLFSSAKVVLCNNNSNKKNELNPYSTLDIAIDNTSESKTLWLATKTGLKRYEQLETKNRIADFSQYTNHGNRIFWQTFIDSKNNLWLGEYNNGLSVLDLTKELDPNNIYKLKFKEANYNIADWTIRSITEDLTGNIWAGSEQFGVLKISPNTFVTNSYKNIPNDNSTISGNIIRKIFVDSNNYIWVGTKFNGLNRFNISNSGQLNNLIKFSNSNSKFSIPNNYISDIFQDSKGRIWISSWNINGGLALFNPATNTFTRYQNNPQNSNSPAENQITAIEEDKNGNLIIGTSEKGFDLFNYNENKFTHFVHNPDDDNSLSSNTITSILTDSQGDIWLGTYNGGLNKFRIKDSSFTHYTIGSVVNKISENRINGIYEDDENNIWVLTANGLNKINRLNNNIEVFLKSNSIDNSIFSITQDKKLNYWATTSIGLIKIDKQTGVIKTFGVNDGLPNINFASRSLAVLENGNLLIGTNNGLIEFSTDDIFVEKQKTGKVVFTSFKVFNKDYKLDTAITYKKNINLAYDENFFSVEFALLDFDNPQTNVYKYKLKGLIDEWSEPQKENYINFANVSDGRYELEILGANSNGIWSKNSASINIIIHPPFWNRFWFRGLIFIFLVLSIYFFVKNIISRKYKMQLHKMEIAEKVREERERISSDLHDNIGANLSGIVTGLEITKKYFNQLDNKRVQQNIGSLESHTKQTIDMLRQAIWSLQDDVKTCGDLLTKVQEFIHHQIISDTQPQPKIICTMDRDKTFAPFNSLNLFRIIQEAVNNSIKYSKSKSIEIKFSETYDGKTKIEIIDYGIGFNYKELSISGKGFGLQNMKKRADKIGAKLEVISKSDEGTRIIIES